MKITIYHNTALCRGYVSVKAEDGKETKLYEVTYNTSGGYIKRLIEIGGFHVIKK